MFKDYLLYLQEAIGPRAPKIKQGNITKRLGTASELLRPRHLHGFTAGPRQPHEQNVPKKQR